MFAGAAVLTRILGVPTECLKTIKAGGVRAYVFRTGDRSIAIAWTAPGKSLNLSLTHPILAFDIMGNQFTGRSLSLTSSPVYLQSPSAETLINSLERDFGIPP